VIVKECCGFGEELLLVVGGFTPWAALRLSGLKKTGTDIGSPRSC
jgi:hypothetical protein